MAGTVASKATRDALFLDRYRAVDLPYVDIAIAGLVGVVGVALHPGQPVAAAAHAADGQPAVLRRQLPDLLVAEPRRRRRRRRCSSPSTCGSACSACWRRRRSGPWPTSCSPRARPSAPSGSSAAAPSSAGSSAASRRASPRSGSAPRTCSCGSPPAWCSRPAWSRWPGDAPAAPAVRHDDAGAGAAGQLAGSRRLALPALDRLRDRTVGLRDHDCRLAVQGAGQGATFPTPTRWPRSSARSTWSPVPLRWCCSCC